MSDVILRHEDVLRIGAFTGFFLAFALFEALAPRRRRRLTRWARWPNNVGLLFAGTLVVRVVFPVLAVGAASVAALNGWGLLNQFALPVWAAFLVSMVLLDLAIYVQHRVFHAIPVLWRLHRVHHADTDLDVTTGVRFHPLELGLSMAFKLVIVALLGAPAVAVVVFEILINASSLFEHANLRLPRGVDRAVRLVIVTPDMHRVHHSTRREETDSNFGFNLSVWDRVFGTYRAQPREGHDGMSIGLGEFRAPREAWIDRLITQPFRDDG